MDNFWLKILIAFEVVSNIFVGRILLTFIMNLNDDDDDDSEKNQEANSKPANKKP